MYSKGNEIANVLMERTDKALVADLDAIEKIASVSLEIEESLMPVIGRLREALGKGDEKSEEDKKWQEVLVSSLGMKIAGIVVDRRFALRIIYDVIFRKESVDELKGERGIFIDNVDTDGKSFAKCDAEMFETDWSYSFVHGPDSLIPVVQLLEKLLQRNEEITMIQSFTWRRPIQHGVKLVTTEGDFDVNGKEDALFEGSFRTNDRRQLSVIGFDDPSVPVEKIFRRNQIVQNCISQIGECTTDRGDIGRFKLSDSGDSLPYPITNDRIEIKINTILDILVTALLKMGGSATGVYVTLKMLGGIRNLPIPSDIRDVFDENGKLEVIYLEDQIKVGRSGMNLVPFEFKFPYHEKPGSGIFAFTDSRELADDVCG